MKRTWLIRTMVALSGLVVSCIGIEHEDIGAQDGATGTTTGTNAGDGDGEDTTDDSGDDDDDSGDEPKVDAGDDGAPDPSRLFVSGDGVKIWATDGIGDDAAPDASLATGDSLALAVGGERLLVATSSQTSLFVFDAALELEDGADPDVSVGVAGFDDAALTTVHEMSVGASGHLWITDGGVRLLENAASLDENSGFDAYFIETDDPIVSAVYDATGTKLLGADSSGGVPAWEDPLAGSGSNNPPVWGLDGSATGRDVILAGGDLFVASADAPFVRVWRDVADVTDPSAADVTLGAGVDGLASVVHLFARGDVLVVTDDSAGGRVLIWNDAGSLTDDESADVTVGDGDLASPTQAILGTDDRLYVRDGASVRVFEDVLGTPALVATIDAPLDSATDMVLIECSQDWACSDDGTCMNGLCQP